mmetsp:Transcript_29221/g.74970  ORF Transcript_29221/g.74970 Transcript_29221/m.74970 type:complete len:415 (-) Transcript_29221:64-1308(-)
MALAATHGDGRMVANHLAADHGERLALRGVDLAGHDAAARLVLRQAQLAQAAARATAQEPDVIGDLHERHRHGVDLAARLHQRVVGRKRLELVGRRHKGHPRGAGHLGRHGLREAGEGVEARADCCAALRQAEQARERALHAADAVRHLLRVAAKFLAQGQGRRVLGVRAPDLDDGVKLFGLGVQRGLQLLELGDEALVDLGGGGDVHDRREGVVGALALVDVVVGVYHLGPQLAAQDLDRAVGDHLVGVHVALRAAARLPHHQREVVRQRAVRHLRRGLHNGAADLGVHALAHVNLGHCALEHAEGAHDGLRHHLPLPADLEVHCRPLSLSAPVPVGGHLERAESVALGARGGMTEPADRRRAGLCRRRPQAQAEGAAQARRAAHDGDSSCSDEVREASLSSGSPQGTSSACR